MKTELVNEAWKDDSTGYSCVAIQAKEMGHWCGYVGVTESHPKFKIEYDHVDASVHGGLTFSGFIKENGGTDGLWYFGFDCAHIGDIVPGLGCRNTEKATYKDLPFVKDECRKLALQLKEMEVPLDTAKRIILTALESEEDKLRSEGETDAALQIRGGADAR